MGAVAVIGGAALGVDGVANDFRDIEAILGPTVIVESLLALNLMLGEHFAERPKQ